VNQRLFISTAAMLLFGALGVSLVMGGEGAPSPLEKAKAGQWVFHESRGTSPIDSAKPDAAKPTYSYQFVEKVEGRQVHLMTQAVSADGKTGLEAPVPTVVDLDQKPADAESEASATSEEELTVKGKPMKCIKIETVTEDPTNGKLTTIRWVSKEVPIFGLVRSIVLNKDKKELLKIDLLDFGDTGGAEKPVGSEKLPGDRKD